MGGNESKPCADFPYGNGVADKPYKWYGFNVLTAECTVGKQGDIPYGMKKYPNVFLYVSIGLAAVLLLILITRIRAG